MYVCMYVRAVPLLCELYPDICLNNRGKSTEKTSVRVTEEMYFSNSQAAVK